MSTRTTKQLDAIVREKLPGYHLARSNSSASTSGSDSQRAGGRRRRMVDSATPSIEELREKFLGGRDSPLTDILSDGEEEDADIVEIEPDDEPNRRRRTKSVVISAEGRILGAQG